MVVTEKPKIKATLVLKRSSNFSTCSWQSILHIWFFSSPYPFQNNNNIYLCHIWFLTLTLMGSTYVTSSLNSIEQVTVMLVSSFTSKNILRATFQPSNGEIVDIKVKVIVEVERQRASWKGRQFQTIHGVESPLRIMTKFQSQELITFVWVFCESSEGEEFERERGERRKWFYYNFFFLSFF